MSLPRICCLLAWLATAALAGPPFATDDPVPVERRHWEVFLASQYAQTPDGATATMPHLDLNYGAVSNVHLNLVVPLAWSHERGGRQERGLGDVSVGAKWRVLGETARRPQLALYPHVNLPSGDSQRGLGAGRVQVQLPLWTQKSWGAWTTYGGGGPQFNAGRGHRASYFGGWVVTRDLSERWTLGGELFAQTATRADEANSALFNLGGVYNLNDYQHMMFAAGRGLGRPSTFQAFAAWQWTVGPRH